jgi:hypothetical protein
MSRRPLGSAPLLIMKGGTSGVSRSVLPVSKVYFVDHNTTVFSRAWLEQLSVRVVGLLLDQMKRIVGTTDCRLVFRQIPCEYPEAGFYFVDC